mgnify:FL=1|jgi:glycosyltransferase involved in cell wall biosynthesis
MFSKDFIGNFRILELRFAFMRFLMLMVCLMILILLCLHEAGSRKYLLISETKEVVSSKESLGLNKAQPTRLSLSIVVPSIVSDIPKISRLLQSISAQLYPPVEVVVVLSGSSSESCYQVEVLSLQFERTFNVIVVCHRELQNQAKSRNDGIKIAEGEWISFLDADDQKQPFYSEIFARYLRSRSNLKLFIHGYSKLLLNAEPVEHAWEVVEGDELWNEEISTRDKHPHLALPVMHSQATVHSSVTKFVLYRTEDQYFRLEDSYFVRDAIRFLRNSSSTIVFDSKPLGWHLPQAEQH